MDDPVYDLVVVGGGVIGACTAHEVAQRGASVLLLDQYEPGHGNGSSHGDGRIFRVAYDEEDYVVLARAALEGWRDLEAVTGIDLLHTTGGLTVADSDQVHTLDELEASLSKHGFTFERLSPADVAQRFPQIQLTRDQEATYQPDSGVLRATNCVQTLWQRVRDLGGVTLTGERMQSVKEDGGHVVVSTASGRSYRGKAAVLAMGGWAARGLGLPIEVTEETVAYFPPKDGSAELDYTYKAIPVFIFRTRNGLGRLDLGYYGLPQIDIPGVKAAAHHTGPVVDPDNRVEGGGARSEESVVSTSSFVSTHLPGVCAEPTHTLKCLYSVTPDHDFIIDRHPLLANVYIGAGFSGHGFKFGPAIGHILGEMALGKAVHLPTTRFKLGRFKVSEPESVPFK